MSRPLSVCDATGVREMRRVEPDPDEVAEQFGKDLAVDQR